MDLSEATLRTYGAVAETFSEEVARRFGVTCQAHKAALKEAYERFPEIGGRSAGTWR